MLYCREASMRWCLGRYGEAALAMLLCVVLLLSSCAQGFPLTEIVSVKGCTDATTTPFYKTTACFKDAPVDGTPIALTLQGHNFPTNGELKVELFESSPHPDPADASLPSGLRLSCEDVQRSSFYPQNVVTCTLRHPQKALAGTAFAALLERLEQAPVWMDVRLDVVSSTRNDEDEEGQVVRDGRRTVAVLRYAVEIDLTSSATTTTANSASAPEKRSGSGAKTTSMLERLYASTPDGATDASTEDLWIGLGIGGLRSELHTLFRRVFLSRLPSLAHVTATLGVQHVRGVILYGPPGNGKTLIARSLFRLLGSDAKLTIVNAADVLSKYVGETEKNIRDIFEGNEVGTSVRAEDAGVDVEGTPAAPEASREPTTMKKGLHVIVIDEFESLFRRRGHSRDESSAKAVYDGVTNMLLSLMDGVHTRNDLLVIGLTNRFDSIDDALLRPGRFEVVVEIPAPDVAAREDIFFIHTDKLRRNGFLSSEVRLRELAEQSNGFSGADIAGITRAATSYALLAYRDSLGLQGQQTATTATTTAAAAAACSMDNVGGVPACSGETAAASSSSNFDAGATAPAPQFEVTAEHLFRAIADARVSKHESSPVLHLPVLLNPPTTSNASGLSMSGDLVVEGFAFTHFLEKAREVASAVSRSDRLFAASIAITGVPGVGKSTVARWLAERMPKPDFTSIRVVDCRVLVEMKDGNGHVDQLREILSEASRQTGSVVVLDDLDVLLMQLRSSESTAVRRMIHNFMFTEEGVRPRVGGSGDDGSSGAVMRENREGTGIYVYRADSSSTTAGHSGGKRVLIITSTTFGRVRNILFDIHFDVPLAQMSMSAKLLAHYGYLSQEAASKKVTLRDLSWCLPRSMTFRDFMRAAETARWLVSAAANTKEIDASTTEGEGAGERTSSFVTELCNTVGRMNLVDAFSALRSDNAGAGTDGTADEMNDEEYDHAAQEGSEILW